MTTALKLHVGFALIMLLAALALGSVAAFVFVFPDVGAKIPFEQLRPMHVSAALFWIISGATAGILHYRKEVFGERRESELSLAFIVLWMATTAAVFVSYGLRKFGGREYWEFPPFLCVPLLTAWILLMVTYFRSWWRRPKDPPLYVWMWTTGIVFFLFTFIEQNLYQIPWFRDSFLREITVTITYPANGQTGNALIHSDIFC